MNRITTVLFLWLLAGAGSGLMAQQGFGTNAPHASSVVEMKSDNKGVLFPRVNLKGTDDTETVPGAADHLLVFNMVTAGSGATQVTPGFYFHEPIGWVRLLVPDDVLSWDVTGNSGVKDGSFLGTTDATDLVMKTNNIERMRIKGGGAVAVRTTAPDASAVMDLSSTTQGFLLPRMTTADLSAIANPANGLLVYNTDLNLPMYYVKDNANPEDKGMYYPSTFNPAVSSNPAALGSTYTNFYNGMIKGTYSGTATTIRNPFGEAFSAHLNCVNKLISAGGCGGVVTVRGASGTVYPLLEINGQCWFNQNSNEIPSAFFPSPPMSSSDVGSWGYSNISGSGGWGSTVPAPGEGLQYQWSAAMNGATAERSRGVCPVGFHIPSDCEFMYLEHGLGLAVILQNNTGTASRYSGYAGNKLMPPIHSDWGASGWYNPMAGATSGSGSSGNRGFSDEYWTSTISSANSAYYRHKARNDLNLYRDSDYRYDGHSVRCLKD